MKGKTIPLSQVVEEIMDCILRDQWRRWSSEQKTVGYALGAVCDIAPEDIQVAFERVMEPDSTLDAAVAEGYVRAQLASPNDARRRLDKAVRRFRAAGGDPDQALSHLSERGKTPFPNISPDSLEAFADLVNAWIGVQLAAGEDSELRERCAADVEVAQAKLFVRDFRSRYPKMLERCRSLAPLAVTDERLNEAHRTYLYGFYRASIVLAWAACEHRLKALSATVDERIESRALLDEAQRLGAISEGGAMRTDAEEIIKRRNRVVHDDWNPDHIEATRVLYLSRDLIEHLGDQSRWPG